MSHASATTNPPVAILLLGLSLCCLQAAGVNGRIVARNAVPFVGSSVLDEVPLIDGHNDFPYSLRGIEHNVLENFTFNSDLSQNPKWKDSPSSHTDLPRLLKGKVGGQFWVAFVSCESNHKDAVALTLDQIDVIKRVVAANPEHMRLVGSADGIMAAFRDKKIASLICVEGGHSIDSRMSVLRLYYELGVRYLTLTHNCNTPWADPSGVDKPGNENATKVGGLSEWGKELVLEMNRLGMMVDLAHVSKAVMVDTLAVSKAPVIFSHSSAYAVHPVARNVHDDVLLKLKENEGILMVNFFTGFVTSQKTSAVDDVIAHLEHVRNLIGIDYIGIGGDYDGVRSFPVGLEDVSKYPVLFDALGERGWSRSDLRKLASENVLRVMRRVEAVRDSLITQRPYDRPVPFADMQAIKQPLDCISEYVAL